MLTLAQSAVPAGAGKQAHLKVAGVDLVYETSRGPLKALEGLSFDVRAGEFVCVVGPSGCGKSTLLKLASGLLLPSSGELTLGGQPAATSAAHGTSDVEAYRLYLDGKQRWALRGTANLLASIDLFTRALERDPQFARAKAGLAIAYTILPGNDTQFEAAQDSIIQLGVQSAREALALAQAVAGP